MIVPVYAPGEWFAVVTDGSVALLPPSTDLHVVEEIWRSLREGADLTAQLQVLLRGGIAALPPFALVSLDGGRMHAVVRGQVEVGVVTAAGERLVSAAQVSTWAEEIVPDAHSVTVRTASLAGSSTDGALPVLSGVVRAAGVRVELVAASVDAVPVDAVPVDAEAVGASEPEPEPYPSRASVRAAETGARRVVLTAAVPAPAPEPAPAPAPEPAPEPAPAPAPALAREPGAAPASDLDDDDLEHTLMQSGGTATPGPVPPPAPAPVAPMAPPAPPVPFAAPGSGDEDHDGMTVLSSDVVALRRQLPDWADDAVPGPLAVPAPQTPPPAKILLSSGLVVSLNRPVLLGRAPQVSRVTNSELPRLVTVASPNQDISRTHAEIRMDGEDVLVTDLRSTNGVLLLRQGHGPQRLHPGEPTVVESGVVVDLGEGVTFIVERGA